MKVMRVHALYINTATRTFQKYFTKVLLNVTENYLDPQKYTGI